MVYMISLIHIIHIYIYEGVRGIDHISFLCICILANLCKSDICLAQFDIHNHDCSNVSKTFCYATTPTLPKTYMFCHNPNINDLITQHLPTIFITTTVTPEECLKLCENAQTTFTLHPNFWSWAPKKCSFLPFPYHVLVIMSPSAQKPAHTPVDLCKKRILQDVH